MLSNLDREQELSRLRHNQDVSRARQSRELQAVVASTTVNTPNRQLLVKVGQMLSTVGDSLQQRYGEYPRTAKQSQ